MNPEVRRELLHNNYVNSYWPQVRWEVDQLADTYVDMHRLGIDLMDLRDGDSALEVGCSDGRHTALIKSLYPGIRIIGVDNNEEAIATGQLIYAEELGQDGLMVGDACALDMEDNSVNKSLALFSAYAAEDPIKFIQELIRVTEPGGLVVITTSSAHNKYGTREIVETNVEYLNGQVSPPITESFTSEIGRLILPQMFASVREFRHRSPIYLRYPAPGTEHFGRMFQYVLGSESYHALNTYQPAGEPKPIPIMYGDWQRAHQEAAWPLLIEPTIIDEGYWPDLIDRSAFVCEVPS